jgi:hypothetical protein
MRTGFGHHFGPTGRLGHIVSEENGVLTQFGRVRSTFLANVGEDDLGALRDKLPGNGEPDAARRAGHDCDLASE